MTDMRFIVSWGEGADLTKDWFSNTLYFTEPEITSPDYQDLADDLLAIYVAQPWTLNATIEIRAYNMSDAKPRPEKAFARRAGAGNQVAGPRQVALCLSYYSERNLPRQRGRIYTGPYTTPGTMPTAGNMSSLITFGQALGNLGGVDVDWSVYSPTTATAGGDPSMSISDIWVDNSWDIIRSRKLDATTRTTAHIGE